LIDLGGGSALLPLPIDVLTLEEKYQMIKLLQSKGANIQELNTVRQAMSQLKNGGLARMAKSKTVNRFFFFSILFYSFSELRLLH
jgi:glycerate-2-kinase